MKPLVIFDCDGVLVDSETIASEVFAAHLSAAGFPCTPQDCRERFTGLSLASCRQLIEKESGRSLPPDFFEHLQWETFARFAESLQPVAGIFDVLHCLQEWQWDFCVASSGSHDKMAMTLKATGLHSYFAGRIFSASEVAAGKPAPDLFLYAGARMGFAASQCIVVEDSLPGVRAAQAASMPVCAFGAHHAADARLCGSADAQAFTCMSELPAILLSMQCRLLRQQEQ